MIAGWLGIYFGRLETQTTVPKPPATPLSLNSYLLAKSCDFESSFLQQRYFNHLTSTLNAPLILPLTCSRVLGCNARTAVINSPENCSIACHCNDSNAGICVGFLPGCDDATDWKRGAPAAKLSWIILPMCAAGNLMITSKSIFTFLLSFFGRRVSLSPAQSTWQRSFLWL